MTADPNWYLRYQWNGTLPAVALDFINQVYWNGTTTLLNPSTFLNNFTTVVNKGLDATAANPNINNMQAIGPLLAAFQGGAYTVMAQANNVATVGGTGVVALSAATGGAVGDLLFDIDATPHLRTYTVSAVNFLATGNPLNLTYSFMSMTTSTAGNYRILTDFLCNTVNDAHPLASNPAQIYVGSATPGFPSAFLNGYIGQLAVIKTAPAVAPITNTVLPAFTGPNAYWCNFVTTSAINYGNVLANEYSQPWTVIAAVTDVLTAINSITVANGVIFTNSKNSPYSGYEIWIPGTNVVGVRIISDFGAGFYLGKYGSTNIADGKWHVVAATYDGSGLAAGVNIYVDGVLETMTVEHDGLAGHSIIGPAGNNQYQIGNQTNALGLIGAVGLFRQYNVVKPLAFIQQFTGIFSQNQQVPAIDATCVLAPDLSVGAPSLTVPDLSASHLTGTLTSVGCWLRGVSVAVPPPIPTGLFPAFTPLLPPPLIGAGGTALGTPVIPAGVPPSTAGKALIIFGTGSATSPTAASWFPSFTTTFPAPTVVFSNVWTVPTLAGGNWTSTLPARTATTPPLGTSYNTGGTWGAPGPSGSGPGPPTYPNPPGAGRPSLASMEAESEAIPETEPHLAAAENGATSARRRRRPSA